MRPLDMDTLEQQIRDAVDRDDTVEIQRLGALMDTLEVEQRLAVANLGSAALWYAEQGLHVFPLQPRSKVPYGGSRGCKDATTDAAQVRDWWAKAPDSNIGIATGFGVDVIDIDGPLGVLSWSQCMYNIDDRYMGPTILGKVSTPRPGGSHLYIAADPTKGNKAGILPGIDHRGTGGYVVAPPSANAEGRRYEWTQPIDVSAVLESA